jgi:hypothetical protein
VIAPRAERSDTVVVHPLGAPALGYYLERTDSPVTRPRYGPPILEDPDPSLDPRHRVWVVLFEREPPEPLPQAEEFVGTRRMLVGEWAVHRVTLKLYGPEPAQGV